MTPPMLLPLLLAATPFPAPAPVALDHCAQAACTTLGEVRVCKCAAPNAQSVDLLVVDRPAERRVIWPTEARPGVVTDFAVQQADLDADGAAELLVASVMSESEGMRIRSWHLAVVDGAEDVAVQFVAHDLPPDWVKGTALFVTEWTYEAVPKQPEPAFVYVGREYEYRHGVLVPAKAPVLRRRYTPEFELERARALAQSEDGTLPGRAFLAHPSVTKGADELPRRTMRVVLSALTLEEPDYGLYGEDAEGALVSFSSDGQDGPLLRLGDTKARRLFPLRYLPKDPERQWIGRAALAAMKDTQVTGLLFLP
ncbi:MAG: hypothetical protein INH37_07100 [Myxococcaceae bacterium]|nr:hypothetical protein [Myxococcaceae bacterium]